MALPNTFGGKPLLDPSALLTECIDRGLPTDHWFGKATIASAPPGRDPGAATFLMRWGDLRQLDRTKDFSLILSDFDEAVELRGWSILRAEAVVSGFQADDEVAYLVRAVDYRHHYRRSPFSKAYNVTTDGTTYVTATTNSGTPWTWAQMWADLWTFLPGTPTVPALPFTPHGTPQNFSFFGHPSAWDALNDVLDRIACVLCYDPVAYVFTIEQLGTADASATAFELAAKDDKVWDSLPQVFVRADRPEKIRVVFRRMPIPVPGSDTTYSVSVTLTSTSGTVAGTTIQIEDDAVAYGPATPTNATYLAARAAERATDWARKQTIIPQRLTRSFRGTWKAASKATGSIYSDLAWEDRGAGLCTEVAVGKDYGISLWDMDRLSQGLQTGPAFDLDVRNTDNTAIDATTTSIQFDKSTGLKTTGTTGTSTVTWTGFLAENSDGSQADVTTNNLAFNKTTGIQTTGTTGASTITLISTSASQMGAVNLSQQQLGTHAKEVGAQFVISKGGKLTPGSTSNYNPNGDTVLFPVFTVYSGDDGGATDTYIQCFTTVDGSGFMTLKTVNLFGRDTDIFGSIATEGDPTRNFCNIGGNLNVKLGTYSINIDALHIHLNTPLSTDKLVAALALGATTKLWPVYDEISGSTYYIQLFLPSSPPIPPVPPPPP